MPGTHTLQQRWFLLASSITVGTAVFGALLYLSSELSHRNADMQNLAAAVAGAVAEEETASGRARHLAVAALDPLIAVACAYDPTGRLLASYTRNAQAPACSTPGKQNDGWITRTARGGVGPAAIRIDVSARRSEVLAVVARHALPVLLALGLVVIAALVIARYLARSALEPITRLTQSARAFDPKAPTLQTTAGSPREVAELASTINRVVDSLLTAQQSQNDEIAQREAAEIAERDAREQLREIIDLVPCLIFARSATGEIVFANRAVADLYETTLDQLLDGSFQLEGADTKTDGLLFNTDPGEARAEECWFTSGSGEARRFLVTRVPFLDGGSWLVIGVDVTEEHRLQMQLQFSQRLEVIGTLAGGIAHDFNNLLTPILGYTSMLRDSDLPEDAQRKLLAVESAAQRARDVVQQILTFSRQHEHVPNRRAIGINAVIEDALQLMRATIPTTIRIEETQQPVGDVVIDPNQLHQVIVNLFTNAAQAITGSDGWIGVRVYELEPTSALIPSHAVRARHACIEVTDNGAGMSREVLGHIFEPFFTTKDVGEGSGLGLSVVHGIVTSAGGEITVDSEPGQGATFRVLLPLSEPQVKAPTPAARVLLVDDEEPVLETTAELLTAQGFEVEAFSNPARAAEAFDAHPERYDVLLTDHNMPEMTGADLALRIRAVRADLPIILITGFATSSANELEGIDFKVMKPVSGRELAMVIQRSLARRFAAA